MRANFGEGVLRGLLGKQWNIIPSIYVQKDPLTMSDIIQVHDNNHAKVPNKLEDLEVRLEYL